jgi:5,10-methylenetetrahydromethanopterin reductase
MGPSLAATQMTPMADAHSAPMGVAGDIADLRSRPANEDDFARRMPAEWIARLAVVGTPKDCAAANVARLGAGADTIVLVPLVEAAAERTRLAAKRIPPLLR